MLPILDTVYLLTHCELKDVKNMFVSEVSQTEYRKRFRMSRKTIYKKNPLLRMERGVSGTGYDPPCITRPLTPFQEEGKRRG